MQVRETTTGIFRRKSFINVDLKFSDFTSYQSDLSAATTALARQLKEATKKITACTIQASVDEKDLEPFGEFTQQALQEDREFLSSLGDIPFQFVLLTLSLDSVKTWILNIHNGKTEAKIMKLNT